MAMSATIRRTLLTPLGLTRHPAEVGNRIARLEDSLFVTAKETGLGLAILLEQMYPLVTILYFLRQASSRQA